MPRGALCHRGRSVGCTVNHAAFWSNIRSIETRENAPHSWLIHFNANMLVFVTKYLKALASQMF